MTPHRLSKLPAPVILALLLLSVAIAVWLATCTPPECPACPPRELPPENERYDVVTEYGATPLDPTDDDTAAIQAAVNDAAAAGGGNVYIPSGTFHIRIADLPWPCSAAGIQVKSNVNLYLEHDTVLERSASKEEWIKCDTGSILRVDSAEDVNIFGACDGDGNCTTLLGLRSEFPQKELEMAAQNPDPGTGGLVEHPAGISILSSRRVRVENVEARELLGDGFLIGVTRDPRKQKTAPTEVELCNVVADHNRRTGLAVTFADDVEIVSSTFENNQGDLVLPKNLCFLPAFDDECDGSAQDGPSCECLLPAGVCKANLGEGSEVDRKTCLASGRISEEWMRFVNHAAAGINLEPNPGQTVTNVQITDTLIRGNEVGVSLRLDASGSVLRKNRIIHNKVKSCTPCPSADCTCVLIDSECRCLNADDAGGVLVLRSSGNKIFDGNRVFDNDKYGIYLWGQENHIAEKNFIHGNMIQDRDNFVVCDGHAYSNSGSNVKPGSDCSKPPPP